MIIFFQFVFSLMFVISLLCLIYQVYQIVVLDAQSKNIKHFNLWSLFSISSWVGILFYVRRSKKNSHNGQVDIIKNSHLRIRKVKIFICFLIIGILGLIITNYVTN